jgi:hypothetical protein
MPNPALWDWWYNFTYQAPRNLQPLMQRGDFRYSWDDLFDAVKYHMRLPDRTHTAIGVRMADSPNRRTSILRYGAINSDRSTFYPCYDWNKADILTAFVTAGVRMSPEYTVFGRTFDGLDYRFLGPLKERYPKDYARVLEMYPLAEAVMLRHEMLEAHYG